jgi:hypothetical protein
MASSNLLLSASSGHYLHVGVINVSVTNLLIVLGMIVVFVLALVLPFPGAGDLGPDRGEQS